MNNLRRIDGTSPPPPPPDDFEMAIGIQTTWPNTDVALAHLVNLVFLVGVLLSPAVVWLVWRQVL